MSSVEESEDDRLLEACRVGDYNEVEKTIDQELIFSLFIPKNQSNDFREQDNFSDSVCPFLEIKDEFGDTPLIVASSNGNTDIVRLLVSMGSHTERVNNEGSNALIEASQNNRVNIVKYLINYTKIDLNHQDVEGCTALISAIGWLDKETVSILLDSSEIDPNLSDNKGESPLHYLCDKNGRTEQEVELSLEIIKILIEKKDSINLNSQNNEGATPLLEAVASENDRVVEYLVQLKDVNKYIPSHDGATPIEEATIRGYANILRMLTS